MRVVRSECGRFQCWVKGAPIEEQGGPEGWPAAQQALLWGAWLQAQGSIRHLKGTGRSACSREELLATKVER